MSPVTVKLIGTLVSVALAVLGHVGIVPVDSEVTTSIATLLFGWLNLRQPGTVKARS